MSDESNNTATQSDKRARELLPCPFCGEAAKHTVWGDAGFNKVECTYCDVGMDYFYHQDDAFEAWNRRAALRAAPEGFVLVPMDPTPEMVKAAEEAYMPFGDMGLAIQMAITASPKAGSEAVDADEEHCESRSPECGPVEHWDSEAVPLCAKCWAELQSADHGAEAA